MSIASCHVGQFSPEFQLACACCRVNPTDADWCEVRRLLPLIDVPAFLNLVIERHRIGPLVHARLRRLPAAALPAGLMPPLAAEARGNAVKALRAVRTHVLMSRWFQDAGIEWLAFKGATLAQRYYGDVGLRQVNDQDLWVPGESLDQARAVLARQGFAWNPADTHWDLSTRGPRHRDFLMRHHIEEQHHSAEHGHVELHWQLTEIAGFFDVPVPRLRERGDRVRMGGVEVPVMNTADLLLYLCEHGSRHCWCRLKWLADLPQMLEGEPLDWPPLLARAEAMGCQRSLLLGLALARDLFGWHPPHEVRRALDGRRWAGAMAGVVRHGLSMPEQWWTSPALLPQRTLLRLRLSCLLFGNWRALNGVVWRLALSPNDLRVLNLPDRLFPLYRLARPFLYALRRFTRLAA